MTPGERLAVVRALFERVAALPLDERDQALHEACGGDASLRDEVAELLRLDREEASGTLRLGSGAALGGSGGSGGGGGAAWLAERLDLPGAADHVPESIGPYGVVRVLGQGSMGTVYEAQQRQPSRRVAIKVIHRAMLSPSTQRRFQRETRAMAALRHPGIVALFEVGSAPLGPGLAHQPYLVMELVEGPTLRREVTHPTLTVEQRLELAAMLADAVHAAHQKGVVHRDLKPENIVLSPAPDGSQRSPHHPGVQPKILDFGVSRLLESEGTLSGRTHAGEVVGTVPYLSPEQAQGEPADVRADVYALGVIAFELLAGRWPFEVKGLGTSAALKTIVGGTPLRLRTLTRQVHPDVHTLVHKAMHADPAQRYASAAEMAQDLRRFLAHEPIAARSPSWRYVASRFVRRHRTLSIVGSTALVLLLAALVVMGLLWSDARRARAAARWESYRARLGAASVDLAAGDVASAGAALEGAPAEYRGWEHRHFASRLDQSRRVLPLDAGSNFAVVPESPASAIVVSPTVLRRISLADGALAGEQPDPRLGLYFAARGASFPRSMPAPAGEVFVPAPAGGAKAIRIANWPAWVPTYVLRAALSTSGRTFAMVLGGPGRHELVVVDLGSERSWVAGLGPAERVAEIALNPDGTRLVLATGEQDPGAREIRLLDTTDGRVLSRAPSPRRVTFALRFAPDGRHFALALLNGSIERWSAADDRLEVVVREEFERDAPLGLSFSADGERLAYGARDGVVWVLDGRTLQTLSEQRGHERDILGVEFVPGVTSSSTGDALVSAARDGRARVWALSPDRPRPLVLTGHTNLVHGLAYASVAERVYTGSWDRTVAMYDAQSGRRLASAKVDGLVIDLALSSDERVVVTREFGGLVRAWDATTLEPLDSCPEPGVSIDQPAMDPAGRRVAVNASPAQRTIRVWDRSTGRVEDAPWSSLKEFSAVWISPRAGRAALSEPREGRRSAVLYDLHTAAELKHFPNDRTAAESVAFTPDGTLLATFSDDNDIRLYDARTLEPLGAFRGHSREVLAMVFSPDGRRLFSADLTGVIRVWDVPTREEVAQLRGHASHLRRLIVTPDGAGVISGSRDGTARLWRAPPATSAGPP